MTFKQISVRLPRLLDKDLNEVARLRPRTQSIGLNITPLSTASLTIDDGSSVPIRSFIELYNAKGSAGIYRVCMPEESFGNGERLELEHGICTLDDAIIQGQGTITGTPRSVFSQILSHQTTKARGQKMWTLGVVEAPDSQKISVEHDGTKTLEMLIRAVNELDGYMLSFSQASFPWIVHVLKKPDDVACEGRLSRNIQTIRKTIDDSDLCTRLYCSLLDNGHIDSDTVDAWGVVEKEITLNDSMTKSEALSYCRKYLNNRKNPTISVEIDADEWFSMTGERLDRFEIGDICRMALPDYGVVVEERIVAMNYIDAIGKPESVTVSLANQIKDMSIKTAEIVHDTNSVKSTAEKNSERLNSEEENITNLKDQADGFKKVQDKMVHWYSSVEIDLDASEESAKFGALASYKEVYDLEQEIDYRLTEAELILNGDGTSANAGLVARVKENEEEISTAALTLYGDGTSAGSGLVAKVGENVAAILANANEIETLVEIKADKVDLGKYATVERLEAELAEFELSLGDSIVVRTLNVTGAASTDSLNVTNRASVGSLRVDGENISLSSATFLTNSTSLTVIASGGTVTNVELNRKTSTIYYLDWE